MSIDWKNLIFIDIIDMNEIRSAEKKSLRWAEQKFVKKFHDDVESSLRVCFLSTQQLEIRKNCILLLNHKTNAAITKLADLGTNIEDKRRAERYKKGKKSRRKQQKFAEYSDIERTR